MLNDKRLATALQADAKSGVLKIRADYGRLDIIGDGWSLMVVEDYVRKHLRKTLGCIVEMLGEIPSESCIEIFKTKDGYAEQDLDEAVFGSELASLSVCSRPEECKCTPVSIGTRRLFQTEQGRLVAVNSRLPMGIALSAENLPVVNEESTRVKLAETSWEFCMKAERPQADPEEDRLAAIWQALESMELVEWPRKEEPISGQMKMAEVEDDEDS